jgi:hypothetical protein
MRARVLYAKGRRPSFRLSNGTFADCDPLDMYAYHVIAHAQQGAVGCIRLVPLADATECITKEIVGTTLFNKALGDLGVSRCLAAECSRWIVAPETRTPCRACA